MGAYTLMRLAYAMRNQTAVFCLSSDARGRRRTAVVQTDFKCKCNIHGKVIIVLLFHIILKNYVQYLFLNNIYGTKENYFQLAIQCLYF